MGLTIWKMFRRGISRITGVQKPSEELEQNIHSKICNGTGISENSNSYQSVIGNKQLTELSSGMKKKRKKRIPKMTALDVLSQASEMAVKIYQSADSHTNDMLNVDKLGVRQTYSDLFPKLKVVPIHSHPQSLVERFTSDSSNQDTADGSGEDNSSVANNDNSNQQFDARILDNSTTNEATNGYYLGNDISSDLSHFMDKNSSKPFNILSESEDDIDVASNDVSVAIHENESTSSAGVINYTHPKAAPSNNEGLVHGIANILEECNNDNMSNLVSNLVKEPVYSNINTSHNTMDHNLIDMPKQESSSTVNSRHSPQNNVSSIVDQNVVDGNIPFLQENLNIQADLTTSSNCSEMSTVDASILGISNQKPISKQNHIYNGPLSNANTSNNQMNYVMNNKSQNSGNSCVPILHAQGFRKSSPGASESNLRYSSSFLSQPTNPSQAYPQVLSNSEGNYDVRKTSPHQHLTSNGNLSSSPNMLISNHASSLLQVAPTATTGTTSQTALQMPSYSKLSNQSSNLKPGAKQFPAMKVSLPPSTGEILVVPGAPASSTMTFHLFAQPTSTQAQPIESHVKVHALNSRSPMQAQHQGSTKPAENQQGKTDNKKSKKDNVYPLKKRSPLPEQQPSHIVPSQCTTLPYQPPSNARTSDMSVFTNTTKPCYTTSSSHLMPVNSATYNLDNSRHSVIRSSTISASQSNAALNSSTYTSTSNAISNPPSLHASNVESFIQNSPTYQTLCPKTLPVVFSSYNRMATNELNAGPVMNITPGKQLENQTQNSNPFVQNVFVPNSTQSLNMNSVIQNSNGQYVIIASPKDNISKLYSRGQTSTVPNSERYINQGFEKPPEIITSMPVLQPPNNNLYQNYTFNGISMNQPQVFNQTTANQIPQYVNIPTYMIPSQNIVKPPVLNIHSQVASRRPVTMSYSGNG